MAKPAKKKKSAAKKKPATKKRPAAKKKLAKKAAPKKASAKKGAGKKPARPARVKAAPPAEAATANLLERAKTRGFLTENEVLSVFTDLEEYVQIFEHFLAKLEGIGVQIVEMKEGILGRREEREEMLNKIRVSKEK